MTTRQASFNTLSTLPRQRSTVLAKSFYPYGHAHHSFDESPQSRISFVTRSMLNCMRRNLPCQALNIFKEHLRLGSLNNIDETSIAVALKACRGNRVPGCQIHGFAIISGFRSYISVSNSLMNLYCKAQLFDRALRIFNNLSDPDIVSCNTILSGFQNSGDALNFALRMNFKGVVFDAVTYTTVLSFCSAHEEFLFGVQLHSLIIKFGLSCEVFVGNALITMYSRWGHLLEAKRVFDEMQSRDLVSWNAILSGYAQEGDYGSEAVSLFAEMVREGMKLDHVSFTGSVSACSQERNLEFGRQIHGLSIKTGYGTHVSVCNVLISMYFKCEYIEDAKSVFWNMNERNVVSWTTMIFIDGEDVIALFNKMRLDGVYPNDVTFVGLIHAISIGNLVEQGQKVHGICIKSSFSSDLNVCNSLITMYAKFEFMEDSSKVFGEIGSRDIISWNALISGYAQNGFCQEALRTFFSAISEAKPNQYTFGSVLSAIGAAEDVSLKHGQRCHSHIIKFGLNSDPIVSGALLDMYAKRGSILESERVFIDTNQKSQFAWTAMISAHARHGDFESVMNWFKAMERDGIRPDSITFLSMLTACGRKGMVDMGRHLFDSMVNDYLIEPSREHYSCLADMLGRAGRLEEAEEVVGHIQGGAGLSVLQSLLGACRIHGNVEMGERVADALMKLEPTESGSYVLLSNLYAEKGEWDKVAKLRKGMREKGVKKEVGFSWVDVGEVNGSLPLHGFSSGDWSHPQSAEIHKMTECLGLEMKPLRDGLIRCDITTPYKIESLLDM
ncbi:pentatricopeptide repeat-containing protein [Tripterygium wilfordii]|uniref:Pentatricopeptide repeat-containing protein n=1 Tax=Tripterygium wilfordii TaxID=458696 RepID=A0A7J7BVQ4_TRIWF|nr:pentatricopeptide repeat-containing protein At4g32430, mitochondrial [Tripterygium wilfordii]KAF5725951.1 pentatricopeptide repeat-containing protein [Tripterygium wilfordii]